MGGVSSFPIPDNQPTSATSGENPISDSMTHEPSISNRGEATSATVVVIGIPQPELVSLTTNSPKLLIQTGSEGTSQRYLLSLEKPDAPFLHTTTDHKKANANPKKSIFPANFGGAGGDADAILPDEVADTFQLKFIGGLQEQKDYLQRSIILPLVRQNVLKDWGVCPPKGILLHGPPGTGKTFMAKAIVNELKKELGTHVNFFYRKGGDVFSMWFGESQRKLRQVFDTAKAKAPSVLFFDEIDGLCPSRDQSQNHGTEAYSSVVTCFLGQMDALENGKVFVIAATNRLDAVDPAVRRPGRFDKRLAFGFPDEIARRNIIQIHTSKWSRADQPSQELVERLAQTTPGFSGADLEKLCKDVVYAAIEESSGEFDGDLKVNENHWRHAMSGMQRTAVNNFGSFLFIPTKPCTAVSKLIEPTITAIIQKVGPMLSANSVSLDPTQFFHLQKTSLLHINHIQQSKSFLNNQLLQGVLSHPLFNKMSLFELSTTMITNKALSGAKSTILDAIVDVIAQAQNVQQTENCAVVIVPNVNELLEITKANKISSKSVLKELAKIRGPKMFLLATSSVPIELIKEARISELFLQRHISICNPRDQELRDFYQHVLQHKKQAYPLMAPLFDTVVETATKLSDNHDFEHILNLASALMEVTLEPAEGEETENAFILKFKDIFDRYTATKMR